MRAGLKSSTAFFHKIRILCSQFFTSVFTPSHTQLSLRKYRLSLWQKVWAHSTQPSLADISPYTMHGLSWRQRAFPFIDRDRQQKIYVYRCLYSQVVIVQFAEQFYYIAPSSRVSRLFVFLKLKPLQPELSPQFFCIWVWQFENNQQRRLAYFIRHAMVCA